MKLFSKFALPSTAGNGKSGLGFGSMGITSFYGDPMPEDKAMELLQTIYDKGCRHFDTAEVYTAENTHNELVLGRFFKKIPRDSYTVATKFWPKDGAYDYETVKASLTGSLDRLQLEYVDLYYAHRVLSLEGGMDFARTAKRLKEEGLVKEVGLSEVGGKWLKQINNIYPIDAVQQEWSLLTRNLEDELVPVCKELDITIVAYSPLARNLLATKLEEAPNDYRAKHPQYSKENLAANRKIVEKLEELAAKYNGTTAQLSLAWLFHKANELGVTVVPIPGSTKLSHAISNLDSTKIEISDEDTATLEGLAAQVAGARGSEGYTGIAIEAQD